MDETYFKNITTTLIIVILLVLSFLLLKPLILSIITGLILAFLFSPVYDWLYKHLKLENLAASLIILLIVILIVLPVWFLTPVVINQSIKIYLASQQIDFVTPLKSIFPSFFITEAFTSEFGAVISSFVTNITHSLTNSLSKLILNFPTIALQFVVVFFVLFFVLRDKEKIVAYLQSLLPFSKEVEKKLFKSTKDVTLSVLYGQILMGVMAGIISGLGFIIFRVPNALILTLAAIIVGILPIVGTPVIWIPVVVYLLIAGNTFAAFGVMIIGLISSIIPSLLQPIFVSKRTNINTSLILIGMLGGWLLFGILGLVIGPLIIAYLFIVLEIYRNKSVPGVLIPPEKVD